MNIVFKKDNKKEFLEKWKEYIRHHAISPRYLPVCLEYMLYYYHAMEMDSSFVVIQDGKPVGLCFLPIENNGGIKTITAAGGYLVAPLASNAKTEKEIFVVIDQIARENNIQAVKFYLDPLIMEREEKFNRLIKYGYLDASSSDSILDLRADEKILWSNLRKNHKRNIKKILEDRKCKIVIIDQATADYEIHEQYRELHHKCAGRITRNKNTFEKQFEMLKNDQAMVVGLRLNGKFIGFCYFFHHAKMAIYASGSDDPQHDKRPLYHAILWAAVCYYKNRGFDFLQFARPCGFDRVSGFDDYLDEKQINISRFKRGFGVKMVPFFRGVKYFDKEYFLKDLENFRNKTLETIDANI